MNPSPVPPPASAGPAPQTPTGAGYVPPATFGPAPQMSVEDERTWATLSHLAPFAAALAGLPFVGALIVYLVYRDRSPFVRAHAAAAVNFQLTSVIVFLISLVLVFVFVGIFLLVALAVAMIAFPIVGAVKASRGESYRYPLTIPFVR